MRAISLTPSAQLELRAAAHWYSEREQGLGREFILEVDHALGTLAEGGHRYPVWRQGRPYQKAFVHRFPYVIFFTCDDDEVRVLAIAHRKRKPGYWLRRER